MLYHLAVSEYCCSIYIEKTEAPERNYPKVKYYKVVV